MNSIVKWYLEVSLILRIFIGLCLGAAIGLAAPGCTGIAILGTLFVGALKAVAPVLVIVLVLNALANAR
ncbi:MAG: serine/threonine transporter SstT, partial [Desulfovibrio sp.]|nr:serine/threonine transporter SstT [Desulfovibrio sp.]